MKDESFTLEPAADKALPPFSYDLTCPTSKAAFWSLREANGRAVGKARTRAGARAGVLALYRLCGGIDGEEPMDRETLREIDQAARAEALKPRRWTPPVAAGAR